MKSIAFKVCLFIIVLAYSFNVTAQTDSLKIDSLKKVLLTEKEDTNKVNTLNELSKSYSQNSENTNAIYYANEAEVLSEKVNFKKGQAISFIRKVYASDKYEDAYKYADSSILIAKELKDTSIIYLSYLIKGQMFKSQENYAEALNNFLESAKIIEQSKDKSRIAFSNFEIANVYREIGNDAEAIKRYRLALVAFTGLKNFRNIAQCYLGIGVCTFKIGHYDTALYNLNQALTNEKKSGFTEINGWILLNLGKSNEMLGSQKVNVYPDNNPSKAYFEEAKSNYMAAKIIAEKDSSFLLPQVYLNLGSLDLKEKKLNEAKSYLDKALTLNLQIDSKEGTQENYLKLSIYDSAIGNFKQAYEDYKLYMDYFKKVQSDSSVMKITQLQNQFDYDKKEAILKAEQAKKDAEAKRIKNQQYFTIGALGIIVLAVIIIALIQFRNNKQKQKANALLQHQKEKVESTLIELKSTQAQLIQSEKMASLGELTAGIAHEIQNPLNFVNNFSEVNKEMIEEMKEELAKGNQQLAIEIADDIKDNEEKINHHGKRADAIVKNMLQHSKQTKGVKEPTDINALCDEYLRLSYHGMRAKDKNFNADFKTDFDESIGKINIVPQDIGRVLLNLFNNAFYAVSKPSNSLKGEQYKPLVSVTTRKLNSPSGAGGIEIIVSDNGNGIPQNIIDKIFQPFFTTKPTGQGTGLGLSLSYDIIKTHGGEIKVETKNDGGATFIITLPV